MLEQRTRLPRPQIAYGEDDDTVRAVMPSLFESHGIGVPLIFMTIASAEQVVNSDLQIVGSMTAAVLDGEFPDGSGQEIAHLIAQAGLLIPIITFAGKQTSWGDLNFVKPDHHSVVRTVHLINADKGYRDSLIAQRKIQKTSRLVK